MALHAWDCVRCGTRNAPSFAGCRRCRAGRWTGEPIADLGGAPGPDRFAASPHPLAWLGWLAQMLAIGALCALCPVAALLVLILLALWRITRATETLSGR